MGLHFKADTYIIMNKYSEHTIQLVCEFRNMKGR